MCRQARGPSGSARPTRRDNPEPSTAVLKIASFPSPSNRAGRAWASTLALEDEGHLDVDLVFGDPAVVELDPLVLDPGRGDAPQGLGGPCEALPDGVLKALRRRRGDLGH